MCERPIDFRIGYNRKLHTLERIARENDQKIEVIMKALLAIMITQESKKSSINNEIDTNQLSFKSSGLDKQRTLELVLVNDHHLFTDYFGSNQVQVDDFNNQLIVELNKIYKPINMTINLVYSETWASGDKINGQNMSEVLDNFTEWASINLYPTTNYDSAHLITGNLKLKNNSAIGLGKNGRICTFKSTGVELYAVEQGVERYSIPNFARTIAHEIAHNLGVLHDDEELNFLDCECENKDGKSAYCIMKSNTFTGDVNEWSDCSIMRMDYLAKQNKFKCLEE
jgi:hypothetical protein